MIAMLILLSKRKCPHVEKVEVETSISLIE